MPSAQHLAHLGPEEHVCGISPGYWAQHALKGKCGTREVRLSATIEERRNLTARSTI